ncbi:restriction endonuclease [Neobacillus niacini]|uniref:nSTAND3 domain-containing NTPase n=1 Tax=Neobacillus niacini TaxID=86668 RepID=UPI0006935654|nr:restriction endonuclease [Neobacillus niacini]
MAYDYGVLSPDEFEKLSHDLLEKHLQIELERFKPGKDGGIDLRHYQNKEEALIVQCKRYKNYTSLRKTLEDEVEKVIKLNPSRYIVTTSVPLSAVNKSEIQRIFKGYIKTPNDIFGKDDFDDLLDSHPDVEKRHFKLWLSNVSIMEKMIHNNIMNRSEFTEVEIKKDIQLYVENESLVEARKILKERNTVILSGIPGVGKTTLAKMLILELSIKDYEIVSVSRDIDEAESVFQNGKKQVFYYDDFLGSNFLEDKLDKNEDKRLISFIEKIKRNGNNEKKFIMTTREYILNQARMKYEVLNREQIELTKHVVDVKQYTNFVKAKILYNHLYFSEITPLYITALLMDRNYMKIINHRNYNPRVIEAMTKQLNTLISPEDYVDRFLEALNNPINIWEHALKHQISEQSRYILYILTLVGQSFSVERLNEYYRNYCLEITLPYREDDYSNGLGELENTFITILREFSKTNPSKVTGIKAGFQNPSIRDFMFKYLQNRPEIFISFWRSCLDFDNMIKVFSIREKEGKIFLDDRMVKIFSDIIIEKYSTLKKSDDVNLDWIKKLVEFFNINITSNIRELVVREVKTLRNLYKLNYNDKEILIKIIPELIGVLEDKEILLMLTEIVENIEEFYEVELLSEIKISIPSFYKKLDEKVNFHLTLRKLIQWEIEFAEEDTSYDYYSLMDSIYGFQETFNLDLEQYIEKIQEYVSEEPDYEPDYDDDRHFDYDGPSGDSTELIDDMFDTLLR